MTGPLDQNHRFSDSFKWLFLNGCILGPLDQNQRFTGYNKWLFIWIFGPKIIWYASHQILQVILDLWTFGLKTDNKKSLYQRWYSNGVWIFGRKTKLICVLTRLLQNLFHVLPDIASIPSLKPWTYLFCNRKMSVTQESKWFYQVTHHKKLP